jgi:hypothetical protein
VATIVAENRKKRFLLYSGQRYFVYILNLRRKYIAFSRTKKRIYGLTQRKRNPAEDFSREGPLKCTRLD